MVRVKACHPEARHPEARHPEACHPGARHPGSGHPSSSLVGGVHRRRGDARSLQKKSHSEVNAAAQAAFDCVAVCCDAAGDQRGVTRWRSRRSPVAFPTRCCFLGSERPKQPVFQPRLDHFCAVSPRRGQRARPLHATRASREALHRRRFPPPPQRK